MAGSLLPFDDAVTSSEMQCDHRDCRCEDVHVERGEKKFCSETCAEMEMSGVPEPLCQCGHPDCAAA